MSFDHLHFADTSYIRALQELMLLSDHVIVPADRCPQCMIKHALSADAYAREATALTGAGPVHTRMAGETSRILTLAARDPFRIPELVRKIRIEGP